MKPPPRESSHRAPRHRAVSILEAYLRALCPFSFLAAFLFLAGACSHETQEVEQWTDLLSKVDAPVEVRDLGGDRRPALTLNPEYPFSFGQSPGGTDCSLRLAFDSRVGEERRTLLVRLESWSESRIIFDQNVDSLPASSTPWQDLEIGLGSQEGPYRLVAQVSGGRLSLASPHAVCRVSRRGSRPSRPHVLLVSIDTLRRDRLGVYGYHRATTPSLDSFAETALVFEQAFAVAPWTLPSHASIFTGLSPEALDSEVEARLRTLGYLDLD